MKNIDGVTREEWVLNTFPEWGTWLNEEIENKRVPEGNFSMWWLGCTGIWLKTHENTNIMCDFWCGTGKRTHGNGLMREGHQMMRMSGCEAVQPNLRNQPFVIDPFAVKDVDALVVTHTHQDHLDFTAAAVVAKNCPDAKFVGPKLVVKQWIEWGVPEERTIVIRPGDEVRIKDVNIVALESSDRTALVTCEDVNTQLKGKMPQEMDDMACNYIFETSGGNLYHSGDSHYSNLFAKHGNEHHIDVALGSFGENPRGITDKLTASDILRMGEALNCHVMIPIHHDIWTNFQSDPNEILVLWKMKKDRLQYQFHPFIWQVGGQYTYPEDQKLMEFNYDRGFHDVFVKENDVPFPSLL